MSHPMENSLMRLVTRSDFDGLICGVLLNYLGLIDDYKFAHPKDLQDGKVPVTGNDVLANVPYVPGCGLWFDHHTSERERLGHLKYKGLSKPLPSCARVIWEFYGGRAKFPKSMDAMLAAVDKVDSADLTREEIENPQGWVLLGFISDPRTGLGRYRDYRISNLQLMMDLVKHCATMPIEAILALPDVRERVARYNEQDELFKAMIKERSTARGNVIVTDLREQEEIYTGNRFLIYALLPQCNVSIQVMWGLKRQNTVFTVGHSILNRTCKADIGSLMLKHGGGGHGKVGTCQVDNGRADEVLEELVTTLQG